MVYFLTALGRLYLSGSAVELANCRSPALDRAGLPTIWFASVFSRFKEVGDKKKFVYDDDLGALVDLDVFNCRKRHEFTIIK